MNLREEIQLIVARIDEDHINHADETMLIINKVLDAVCAEINNVGLGAHNTTATINAVNKLRGE